MADSGEEAPDAGTQTAYIASVIAVIVVFCFVVCLFIWLNFCPPFRYPFAAAVRNRNAEDRGIELQDMGNAQQQQQQQPQQQQPQQRGLRLLWDRLRLF